MNTFKIIPLKDVEDFILKLPIKDQYKISAATDALKYKKFESVYIKQLKGEIKELRVKNYRLLFFIHDDNLFFVRIFVKKSRKTPRNEIHLAEKFYKLYITN